MKINIGKSAHPVFLIAIFLVCCKVFYVIFFQPAPATKQLFSLTSTETTHQIYPVYSSALEAKAVIPDDAPVEISPAKLNIYRLAAKYLLYPIKLSKDWFFFIDFDNTIPYPYPTWDVYELSTGVKIFAKPGHEFLLEPNSIKPYSPFKIFIIFLAVVALNLGFGALLLHLLGLHRVGQGMMWFWGTSYIIGMILFTIFLWLFLLLGGPVETNILTIVWVMASLMLLLVSKNEKAEQETPP